MIGVIATTGCDRTAAPVQIPPPEVTVRQPTKRVLTNYKEFAGRIEATERVEIRARVKGFLKEIHFKEGAEVRADALLYEIDPREYETALAEAKATEKKQEAQVQVTMAEANRAQQLLSSKAISQEEYQQRIAAREVAKAVLQQSKAAVTNAQLQLDFTKIHAPIAGRVGRTLLTKGNLVGSGESTLLTTLVAVDPVYVYFEVPEREFLNYQKTIREKGAATAVEGKIPVYVSLTNETGYPHEGLLDFRNNQVEPGTGTIQLRGQLPNPDRLLTPGLFARVRVPIGAPQQQLLVPELALSSDQRGSFVLVVRDDKSVEAKLVKTGATTDDGLIVLLNGVQPDDWIVVNGLQRARPGTKVKPIQER